MTDTSKRIDADGVTLFQLGFESLLPNDGKAYCVKKGDSAKIAAEFVEAVSAEDLPADDSLMVGEAPEVADIDGTTVTDVAGVITAINGILAKLRTRGVIVAPAANNAE